MKIYTGRLQKIIAQKTGEKNLCNTEEMRERRRD